MNYTDFKVDTHTHTIASGHAYSTLKENAMAAFDKGMEGIVLSDHGPALEGCPPEFMLRSVTTFLPEYIEGVRVIKGIECNIIDHEGTVDISNENLDKTEFALASMHGGIIESKGMRKNTEALIYALQNPYIDVIGHPGNGSFPIDKERFVAEVARQNKLVEINDQSFYIRPNSMENCSEIARLCKKHDVRIVVSSDAHYHEQIGEFDTAISVLEKCRFPHELIVSTRLERFMRYITEERMPRIAKSKVEKSRAM